jgi:class 3 adenylate cyclase
MERRLTAILAADVVGYSRLMEANELETFVRLKQLREQFVNPAVARHQGRIVKLTGDGILVDFARQTRFAAPSSSRKGWRIVKLGRPKSSVFFCGSASTGGCDLRRRRYLR